MTKRVVVFISMILFPVCGSSAETKPQNLLLITIDTLRADHLGYHGYSRATTPEIDRLAGQSLVFRRCYSHSSYTPPSIATLMTGLYPYETGVFHFSDVLPESVTTLAELFQRRGFQTAAVVSNFVLRKGTGFEQGFSTFNDEMLEKESHRNLMERNAAGTTGAALEWLQKKAGSPFFLWVHFQDPHGPYSPPAPYDTLFNGVPVDNPRKSFYRRKFVRERVPDYHVPGVSYDSYVDSYDGEVRYVDAHVGALVKGVKKLGLFKKTLIVLTSDHGEAMGECRRYFEHGKFLFPALIHVPLIIYDGRTTRTVDETVQHLDVFQSLVQTFNLDSSSSRGRNILSKDINDLYVFSETDFYARLTGSKFQFGWEKGKDGHSLYDLNVDPEGASDVSSQDAYHDVLREIRAISDRIDPAARRSPPPTSIISEEIREKLKSLGYAQ